MSMRKLKKISSLAVVTALTVGSLAGCGSKNNNTTNTGAGASTGTNSEATQAPTEDATQEGTTTEAVDIKLKVWAPQEEQTSYEGYGDSLLAYMCEAFDEAHPEWNIEFD